MNKPNVVILHTTFNDQMHVIGSLNVVVPETFNVDDC